MNRLYTVIVLLIASSVSTCNVIAQSLHTTDAASDFQRGHMMYLEQNYLGCIDIMQSLLNRSDATYYYEDAAFYVAMSQAHRISDRTPQLLLNYLKEYPYSTHRNEILLALGNYYYYIYDYSNALTYFTQLDINNINSKEQDTFRYRTAYCYVQTEQPDKALPLFHAMAQNSVQFRNEARYYEGYIYYEKGEFKKAAQCLTKVQSNSEYGYESQYILTNIHFVQKDYAKVIAVGEQLIKDCTNPTHLTELHRIVGESHYQLGNEKKAESHLTQYLDTSTSPLRNTCYMAGMIAYRNKQYDKALQLLTTTLDEDDRIAQNASLHIGYIYTYKKDLNKARIAFEQAASSKHDAAISELALYNQAMCAYESEFTLFDSTISLFDKFLAEYPRSIYADEIRTRLTDLHITSRDYKAALNYIEQIKQPSDDILRHKQQILYLLGTEAFANNRIQEAGEWFGMAFKQGNYAPEYRTRSLFWLGECCYREKNYEKALKCYNEFLGSNVTTDNATVALAYYNIAYCHFELQQFDKALTSFTNYIKLDNHPASDLLIDAYNRLADCYFYSRQYATAEKYYLKAAKYDGVGSDYGLLQQAVAAGAQKGYNKKANLLETFIAKYPQSEYSEEAYNELGETYVITNRATEAINTYKQLMQKHPECISARKATLQLGSLYYSQDDIENSIAAYQSLIIEHPSSNEAKMAAEDLKSIYIELNRINELSAFMQQQGVSYQRNELDSLSYLAAERSYLNNGESKNLEEYLTQYPEGNYAANANYYLGNVKDTEQDYDMALIYYQQSLRVAPESEFAEAALTRCSNILYDKEQYAQAAETFSRLENIATTNETRQEARLGALRSYTYTENYEEVVSIADRLLTSTKLLPEVQQEIIYCRAIAYTELGELERAKNDYILLAEDTRTIYGAEATFRIVEYLYNNNKIDEAEKVATAFIERGTPHAYWLARNFITLSDIYLLRGDLFTARQYLINLQESYPGEGDDIDTLISERLILIDRREEEAQQAKIAQEEYTLYRAIESTEQEEILDTPTENSEETPAQDEATHPATEGDSDTQETPANEDDTEAENLPNESQQA